MGYLARDSTICAGIGLRSADGRATGRLGLLAVDGRGDLFGISVLSVASAGSTPEARLSNRWVAMGPSRALALEPVEHTVPVERLLALVEVPKTVQVSPNVPNVGNVSGLIDPIDPFGFSLHLATIPPIPLGSVQATMGTVFLRDQRGAFVGYGGVVEVECRTPLAPGFAGAVVITAIGEILGIAIAADRDRLFVAPLGRAFAARGLNPLAFGGGLHNEEALELQAAQERAEAERARAKRKTAAAGRAAHAGDDLGSDEIFKKYAIEKIIPKQAA